MSESSARVVMVMLGVVTSTIVIAAPRERAASAAPSRMEDHPGAEPYNQVCGACHGEAGRGDEAPRIVPLAYDVDFVLAIVREGYGQMPPISTRELTDEQVREIVGYLESVSRDESGDD